MASAAVMWLVALTVVLATWVLTAAMHRLVWRPYAVGKAFRQQGIRGPAYRFFVGSNVESEAMRAATANDVLDLRSHDILPRVLPQCQAWMASYGKVFLAWQGYTPALWVADYDMVKQILCNKSTGLYSKTDPGPNILAMLGNGLVFADGDLWVRHRRVVHPAFTMDKLKMMAKTMAECAEEVVGTWEARACAADGAGVARVENIGQEFVELTADVISHTAFGCSYREGKEVFEAQRELQDIAFSTINNVRVPGLLEYLPTKTNFRRWQLTKKVRGTLMAIIRDRQAAAAAAKDGTRGRGYGNDLLGLMLQANKAGTISSISMDEIIDECKTFFVAGHETTSHLLTWAVFLLGTHPEWQHKLREEVLRECGSTTVPLNGDALNKLKIATMVLYETLRLYGSVMVIARRAAADADLGGLKIPKGTTTMIPIAVMHRDKEVWGADAGDFNPERFREGVRRAAKHPSAMLAFSVGSRSCIGQDFAMLEAKATLALILRRFHFEVAPEYVHAPTDYLTLQPKCGLPILLKLLDQ